MADKPSIGEPEPPPPPRPIMFAGFTLAFSAATSIALVMGQCDVGTVLSLITTIFAAATFFLLLGQRTRPYPYYGPSLAPKEGEKPPAGGPTSPEPGGPNDPTYRR